MARKIQINISNKVFYTLITFSLMIIFGVVVYAYNSGYGDPAIFGHSADEIEGGGSMSSGSIISFYLSSCPTGWILADGANGTPDLRGAFIRCMYGDQNGRDVARILGSFQNDLFKSHAHSSLAQGGYEW
ncbi:MAG: hypothetical protein KKF67_03165, partial [Nanoarchaeota archaeon]|nr:hypothetical protein [Nanoarchaeota archaeon]